ncbi:hypothetical protein LJC49_09990 [Ruminococcaceae bacterium OttesenSCG-928-I18]|nr:hypothetical protein [Ruminococcaceae bacterium OttesenSCG-928-I18]
MTRQKGVKGILAVLLVTLLLVGCAGDAPSETTTSAAKGAQSETSRSEAQDDRDSITVRLINSTNYAIDELYLSSSEETEWGGNLLDATLPAGEAVNLELEVAGSEYYDLKAQDEDADFYYANGLLLQNRTKVTLRLSEGVLTATVRQEDGTEETLTGELELVGVEEEAAAPAETAAAPAESAAAPGGSRSGTGHDTNGAFSFTVNNNSYYDIYAIWVGIYSPEVDYDQDLLPEILPSGQSTVIHGVAHPDDWDNPDWTIWIQDVEGDVSASYDKFNPFLVQAVDVQWSNSAGGYVVEFTY